MPERKPYKMTENKMRLLEQMLRDGYPRTTIADALGIHRSHLYRMIALIERDAGARGAK